MADMLFLFAVLLVGFVLGEYFAFWWVYRLLTHHGHPEDPVRVIDYIRRRLSGYDDENRRRDENQDDGESSS